jgi:hypothetical protein
VEALEGVGWGGGGGGGGWLGGGKQAYETKGIPIYFSRGLLLLVVVRCGAVDLTLSVPVRSRLWSWSWSWSYLAPLSAIYNLQFTL